MISLLRAAGTKCLAPALTHLGFRFQQSGPVCSLSWGGGTPGCCAVLAPGASGAARSRGRGAECLLGPGSAQGPPPGPRPPRPPLGIEAASLAQTNTRAHYTDLRLWRPLEAVGRQLLWQVPRAAPQPRDPPGREKARDCPSFPPGSQLKGGARPCAQPRPPSPFLPCHSPRLTPGRPSTAPRTSHLGGRDGVTGRAGEPYTHQPGRMDTLLVVLIVPASCGVTLAQPQRHRQHDTETLCRGEVQRRVCSWPLPPCSHSSLWDGAGARRTASGLGLPQALWLSVVCTPREGWVVSGSPEGRSPTGYILPVT